MIGIWSASSKPCSCGRSGLLYPVRHSDAVRDEPSSFCAVVTTMNVCQCITRSIRLIVLWIVVLYHIIVGAYGQRRQLS